MATLLEFNSAAFAQEDNPINVMPKKPTPIGIGKPLSVEILSYYTGEFGRSNRDKQLLICSSIKGFADINVNPKAINQLIMKAEERKLMIPSAASHGSQLLFYTKALDQSKIMINVEMGINRVNSNVLDGVANLVESASNVPAFLSAKSQLLIGAKAIRMGNKALEFFAESKPKLQDDLHINIDDDFFKDTESGVKVLVPNGKDMHFKDYTPFLDNVLGNPCYKLIHKETKKEYSGELPYIFIGISGKERPSLDNFLPLLASQEILQDFFNERESIANDTLNNLNEAMSLYNDMKYLKKANELARQLEDMNKDSDEYEKNLSLFEAYRENIMEDVIKKSISDPVAINI